MSTEIRRYPGPKPFSQWESVVFNARGLEVDRLYQALLRNDQVMLYAKSGVGKSSLVNAGLIPKVLNKNWLVVPVRFFPYQPKDGNQSPRVADNEMQGDPLKSPQLEHDQQKCGNDYQTPIAAVYDALLRAVHPKDPLPGTARIAKAAATAIAHNTYLSRFVHAEPSLWTKIKPMQADGIDQVLLVFDQLEELFTYPVADILTFKVQLADLLYEAVPAAYLDALRVAEAANPRILTSEELAHLYRKQPIKALGAIRDDAMHHLVQLVDYLPEMQQNLFELKALSKEQARTAIVEPAKSVALAFTSPQFVFAQDSLDQILGFLTKGDDAKPADATLLQIICQGLEKESGTLRSRSIEGLPEITINDLPDFGDLVKEFYLKIIQDTPGVSLMDARKFIEGRLIANRKRIPVADSECVAAIGTPALKYLVSEHLLRQEKNSVGDYSYELGHDTLVDPIAELKEAREKAQRECQEREEALKAEEARKEREKQLQAELELQQAARDKERIQLRRTRRWTMVSIVVLLIAFVAAVWAFLQKSRADDREKRANEEVAKNKKLISAFYFYEDSLALANDGSQFGYVNKLGDAVIDYQFDLAGTFEDPGFARVEIDSQKFMVSTSGEYYAAAFSLEHINESVQAVALDWVTFGQAWHQVSRTRNLKMLSLRNIFDMSLHPTDREKDLPSFPWILDDKLINPDLELLEITRSGLDSLSPSIEKINHLQRLSLAGNQLRSLPPEIGGLVEIKTLDLSSNRLRRLPSEIGRLSHLTKLKLFGNQLLAIPVEIGKLSSLRELFLSSNELSFLPQKIGMLDSLRILAIDGNKIRTLPLSICGLKFLLTLDASNNMLNSLPAGFESLETLKYLDLGQNQFKAVPVEVMGLHSLLALQLHNNYIDSLPVGIGNLRSLVGLNLDGNPLKFLPDELGRLNQLAILRLKNDSLLSIPNSIMRLPELIDLDLSDNPNLEVLPNGVWLCSKLVDLDLSNCGLKQLPIQIFSLRNLRWIDLSYNMISRIPEGDINGSVRSVRMEFNKLTTLPESVGGCKSLEILELKGNNLAKLPRSFPGLTSLNYLDLEGNKFESFPIEVCSLPQLKTLILSGNDIESIPEEIKEMKNLEDLVLRCCPLDWEIIEQLHQWLPNCNIVTTEFDD